MRTSKYIISGKVNNKIIEHTTDSYNTHCSFLKKILPKLKLDNDVKTIRHQLVRHSIENNMYDGTFTDLSEYDYIATHTHYIKDSIDGYDINLAIIDVSAQIDELNECEI